MDKIVRGMDLHPFQNPPFVQKRKDKRGQQRNRDDMTYKSDHIVKQI